MNVSATNVSRQAFCRAKLKQEFKAEAKQHLFVYSAKIFKKLRRGGEAEVARQDDLSPSLASPDAKFVSVQHHPRRMTGRSTRNIFKQDRGCITSPSAFSF